MLELFLFVRFGP